MAAVSSPLQELADAAEAAQNFRLTTRFDLSQNKSLAVAVGFYRISGKPHWWLQLTEETNNRSTGGFHSVSSFEDAVRKVASDYPSAVLPPESVKVNLQKGTTTGAKLRPVAIQAWHEAFGRPIPTLDELAEQLKASKAATKSEAEDVLALLKTGRDGVRAFNKRPLKARAGLALRKADLVGYRLDGVDFAGADLEGADLSGASLAKARFFDDGLYILQGMPKTRLKAANFVGADLSSADLSGCSCNDADFRQANLARAVIRRASMLRANFDRANLSRADLSFSELKGADFHGATLTDANFDRATFDESTRWPSGFVPPDGMVWKGAGADPRQAPTRREKSRPRPTDFAGFLDRLKNATDSAKLDKAMKMLKADRFRLFAKVDDNGLVGVVKSQSDPDLVYSCRLASDGTYGCCTQNLNVCGGLRGSPCKHLLVLVVGLTQAGEIEPATAHDWPSPAGAVNPFSTRMR